MKRLKLEEKDIDLFGFERIIETESLIKWQKGDFIIWAEQRHDPNLTRIALHSFDDKCPFNFTAPMKNISTEIIRSILKWNADVVE